MNLVPQPLCGHIRAAVVFLRERGAARSGLLLSDLRVVAEDIVDLCNMELSGEACWGVEYAMPDDVSAPGIRLLP